MKNLSSHIISISPMLQGFGQFECVFGEQPRKYSGDEIMEVDE